MLFNSPAFAPSLAAIPLRRNSNPLRRCRRTPPACCTFPPSSKRPTLLEAVDSHLRKLGADEAADLAYVSLSNAAPSTLSSDWQTVLDHLASLGLHGDSLSRLASRLGIPVVLRLDASRVFRVTQILCVELDLSPSMLRSILIARPHLLSAEDEIRATLPALRATGMRTKDIQQVIHRWPGLLTADATALRRSVAFLCGPRVGFTPSNLPSLLRRAPWILVYDVDKDMAPASSWLHEHMEDAGMVEHCIRSSPNLLGTPRYAMQAVTRFLQEDVSVREENVRSIIRSFPAMLTCSVEKVLRPAVNFLRDELSIPRGNIAKVVRAFPAILTLDVDSDMRPVVQYFKSKGVGNVGRLVTHLPPVLGYDLETNIIPKMDYLEQVLGLSSYDIARFPGYFSYSLEKRIEPRTRYLQALGRSVSESGLNMALALTDVEFSERVAETHPSQYYYFRKVVMSKGKQNFKSKNVDDTSHESTYLESLDKKDDSTYSIRPRNVKRRRKKFKATTSKMPWDRLK